MRYLIPILLGGLFHACSKAPQDPSPVPGGPRVGGSGGGVYTPPSPYKHYPLSSWNRINVNADTIFMWADLTEETFNSEAYQLADIDSLSIVANSTGVSTNILDTLNNRGFRHEEKLVRFINSMMWDWQIRLTWIGHKNDQLALSPPLGTVVVKF